MAGSCEHGNEPSVSIKCWKFLSSCATGAFSRRVQLHRLSCVIHQICLYLGIHILSLLDSQLMGYKMFQLKLTIHRHFISIVAKKRSQGRCQSHTNPHKQPPIVFSIIRTSLKSYWITGQHVE